jgi:branched-chain amino acid transport system substrate-binding protein
MGHARLSCAGTGWSRRRFSLAGMVLALALGATACGSEESGDDSASVSTQASEVAETAEGLGKQTNPANDIADYVEYTGGTDGPADTSKKPIKIGWVNNQGGSVAPPAPTSTEAAKWAVKYINEKLGGVGGRPLELVTCFVKNSEEEGLGCAQKFLNDPDVVAITYGGVAVGANTITATVDGKLPVLSSFALNPSDANADNTYILFAAGAFSIYGWGTFGAEVLKAKTNAVLYPEGPGLAEVAAAVKEASEAAGIKSKLVGFEPNATDLTGALTAAGAPTADMISPIVVAPEQCLALDSALNNLGVAPEKVVGLLDCSKPELWKSYPDGDAPKWYYGIAQSGDPFIEPQTPAGKAFEEAVLDYYPNADKTADNWFSSTFALMLTIQKFMNELGADNITPEGLADKAKNFKGPMLMGGAELACGKYPNHKAVCGDGDQFFRYMGDGKYKAIGGWIQTPIELQKKLGAQVDG